MNKLARIAAVSVGLLVASLVTPRPANAGTQLHFVNGSVVTKDIAQAQLSTISSADETAEKASRESIIQFKSAVTELDKQRIQKTGAKIYRYFPDDALVIRATAAQLKTLKTLPGVHAVLNFRGDFKVSQNFPAFSVFSQGTKENVLISAFTAEDAAQVLAYLQVQDPSLQVIEKDGRALAVRMNQALIAGLSDRDGIEFVEPLNPMKPMHMTFEDDTTPETADPLPRGDYTDLTGYETGTKVMNFDTIWAAGYTGNGQIVGMADTGLDDGTIQSVHPDFQGAVKSGYIFGVGAKSWEDTMGHGTHVAGSVLGRGVASGNLLRGGAYGAQIIPQGMWSPIIDNLTVPPKLNKLFDAAYADGARLHTNSWGAARNFGAYDSMAQQVDEFMWDHPDFLILFAAGNSGIDADKDGVIDSNSVGSPGTAKDTLTVGASENLVSLGGIQRKISDLRAAKDNWPSEPIWSSKLSDDSNGMAMFSSRGPALDGRIKPEISAPGTNILSVKSSKVKPEENFWGAYSKDYMYSGGTSMATPLVAGAAAVTREVLVKKYGFQDPSAALVKATLLHTAFDMFPGQYGQGSATQEMKSRRPNNEEGYGRVDMAALAGLTSATQFVDSAGIAQGESADISVNLKSGALLVNLVYTDAPGTPSAGATLVNDLDLVVTGPNGQVLTKEDHVNPHEIFEMNQLPAGSYKVAVRATKVPMGKLGRQPYALVVTAR
jgi:subtilisin family serine protease